MSSSPTSPALPEPVAAARLRRIDIGDRLRDVGIRMLAPAASLFVAAVVGGLVITLTRRSPSDVADVAGTMWSYGLANRDSFAFIFGRATPLIFAGLATAIAFRAGMFNIGVEGQYAIGAVTAAVVGYSISAPLVIHLPLTILAGMAGGMLWALIPALLKVYRGAHEVISTIMMNYLANGVLLYLLSGPLRDRHQIAAVSIQRTPAVHDSALVGSMVPFFNALGFNFRASAPVTWFFVLALAAAGLYAFVIKRSRFGYEVRVVGTNPRAAEPSGIRTNTMFLRVMLISGAIAGLVGLQDVLSIDGYFRLDYVRGFGFTGIAIALLGRNTGIGIVAGALLFAFLDRSSAGIGLNTSVPQEVTTILQGVVLLTIVVCYVLFDRLAARLRLRETHERA